VDTEAITSEIVRLRRRLAELEDLEGAADTDVDDERATLHERMRELQDLLSGPGPSGSQDRPAKPDTYRYVPPA